MANTRNVLKLGRNRFTTVLLLAWPAVIEQIMLTMVGYVDTAMVGYTGALSTAAVGITTSTMWLITGIFSAFGVGFSVQAAQLMGSGDYAQCRSVIRQSIFAVIAVGGLVTVICQLVADVLLNLLGADASIRDAAEAYFRIITLSMIFQMSSAVFSAILRCVGDTKTPMVLNICTNV